MMLAGLFPLAIVLVIVWYVKGERSETWRFPAEPRGTGSFVQLLAASLASATAGRRAGEILRSVAASADIPQQVA
jgi:hypothetical protein